MLVRQAKKREPMPLRSLTGEPIAARAENSKTATDRNIMKDW
jgi:hypothetical protein